MINFLSVKYQKEIALTFLSLFFIRIAAKLGNHCVGMKRNERFVCSNYMYRFIQIPKHCFLVNFFNTIYKCKRFLVTKVFAITL